MFKHILVPINGTDHSNEAVKRAIALGKEDNSKLTFFYARPSYPENFRGNPLTDQSSLGNLVERDEIRVKEILGSAEQLARQQGVSCSSLSIPSDTPYEAIIDAANSSQCDLIVMTAHDPESIKDLLVKSETLKVLNHSKIPVLVYH